MKKIIVDENLCIGCGACVSIDPEHFDFNDNGFATCIKNDNIDTDELKTAIDSCPTSAIRIEENNVVSDESFEEEESCCIAKTCDNCSCSYDEEN